MFYLLTYWYHLQDVTATTTILHLIVTGQPMDWAVDTTGSHHHEWDLLWARSPIRERHIRWQIWHSKLLAGGEPDLHRSRLDSNSWMRRISDQLHSISTTSFRQWRIAQLNITCLRIAAGARHFSSVAPTYQLTFALLKPLKLFVSG